MIILQKILLLPGKGMADLTDSRTSTKLELCMYVLKVCM